MNLQKPSVHKRNQKDQSRKVVPNLFPSCFHLILGVAAVQTGLSLASAQAFGTHDHGTGTDWPLGTLHLPSRPPHLHRRRILRSG